MASGVKSAQVIAQCERELHEAKMSIHALQALAEIEGDTRYPHDIKATEALREGCHTALS